MANKDGQALRTLYANLMDEVKLRIDCIDRAVRGQTGFPSPIVREFCYGQLRMLCELVSLGCLVAHGDIPATYSKRLGKEWSADTIMKELERLRPHFYPNACRQTGSEPFQGVKKHGLEGLQMQPFPKEALLQLYGETHRHLHRGNVRKLLVSDSPIDMDARYPEIISWAQKIHDQLAVHLIAISEDKVIICVLRNGDDNNKVQVVNAEKRELPL